MEQAQGVLSRLAELAHEQQIAIREGSEERIMAVDQRIELTLGEKERALGALRQHRQEHGC
jgi:hypothetical protein